MPHRTIAALLVALFASFAGLSGAVAANPTWALYRSTSTTTAGTCMVVQEKTPDQQAPAGFTSLGSKIDNQQEACQAALDAALPAGQPAAPDKCSSYNACTVACCKAKFEIVLKH